MNDTSHTNHQAASLKCIDAIRQRPAMYIGDTGIFGFNHLVHEVMDNSIEEVMSGFCTEITLTLLSGNTVRIEDNGRGIPVEDVADGQQSFLERVMTVLHADRPNKEYYVQGGIHGVGLAAVNAVCESLIVDVYRNDTHYRMEFARGVPLRCLEALGVTDRHGTTITFTPDPEIFGEDRCYLPEMLCDYLRELACLNPEATLRFKNAVNGDCMTYHYPTGIRSCSRLMNSNPDKFAYGCMEDGDTQVEIAFQYDPQMAGRLCSYANSIRLYEAGSGVAEAWANRLLIELGAYNWIIKSGWSLEGLPAIINWSILCDAGPEVVGFLSGVRQVLVREAMAKGMDVTLLRRLQLIEVASSVDAIVSLRLPCPKLTGPTHTRLAHSLQIRCLVKNLTVDVMSKFCAKHPDYAEMVLKRIADRRGDNALEWLHMPAR